MNFQHLISILTSMLRVVNTPVILNRYYFKD